MTVKTAYVLAAAIGAALWIATAQMTGRREAWDASQYWMFAYPLGAAAAAALAFAAPHPGAWRLGLVLMLAQALSLVVSAREFGLLPLGLVLFTILAVVPATAATLAAAVAVNRRS